MKLFIRRVLIASLCVVSCTAMAGARSFDRSSVHTGPKGTTTSTVHQQATPTGYVRDRTTVNPKGQVASRHTEVDKDPITGVISRSVDAEKFNGKTYSKDSTRTPTAHGFVKETTVVTPNGKTHEKTKVVERSPGVRTADVTRVNGRGQVSHRHTQSLRN